MNDRNRELKPFVPQPDDDMIVCRCEEITKGEIRRAVHDGMFTLTEIRRYLRTGMGLCQGQTCTKLVKGIVSRELGVRPNELGPATGRAAVADIFAALQHKDRNAVFCKVIRCRTANDAAANNDDFCIHFVSSLSFASTFISIGRMGALPHGRQVHPRPRHCLTAALPC